MSAEIKLQLFSQCQQYVQQRITSIQESLSDSQESANSETKSTAGDKHDTARAMMQLAVEQKSKQLAEANKLTRGLNQINPALQQNTVQLGALVYTNLGIYYMAISLGKIEHAGINYFVISPGSPIGQALFGLKQGDQTTFNNQHIAIEKIV